MWLIRINGVRCKVTYTVSPFYKDHADTVLTYVSLTSTGAPLMIRSRQGNNEFKKMNFSIRIAVSLNQELIRKQK
jgi:hypothetical protein